MKTLIIALLFFVNQIVIGQTLSVITSSATASVTENNVSAITVTATDDDPAEVLVYSISGGIDATMFSIDANFGVLTFNTPPNFENPTDNNTDNEYELSVQVIGNDFLAATQNILITVTNLNESPTDIALSATSINENVAANAPVGTFTTTDVDASNTFTYTLVSGTGDTDNATFSIVGNTLHIVNSPNYEVDNSFSIRIRSTDQGSLWFEKTFVITVTNLNESPTDIALSATSINENVPANAPVGTFTTTDVDAANTFTYTLVSGTGDTDNATFSIVGNTLHIVNSPNYEVDNSFSIRIRSTDQGSLPFEKAFTIIINDVNEAPTNLTISKSSINENVPANSLIGVFSTTDVDAGSTFIYALASGAGNADNAFVSINDNDLYINDSPNFESKDTFNIRIRTTDQGGIWFEKAFIITINDVNDKPTNILLSATTINENVSANASVGTLSSTDPDAGNTFTYSIVSGAGGTDNASFTVAGSTLRIVASPDFETQSSYNIRIRTTDQDSAFYEEAFSITIFDLNEAPIANNVSISGNTTVCKTLTGSYTYSDPENNPQSVSTFKWYWASTLSGAKTVISGAVSSTYTLTTNEYNKYIFFEVTPKASDGVAVGTPVISAASTIVTDLLPTVAIYSSSPSFCDGKSVNLTFTFAKGTPPFNLTYTNGTQNYFITSNETNHYVTITKGGTYKGVTLTDNLNCPVTNLPSTVSVTLNPLPVVKISGLNTAYNVNNSPVVMTGTPIGGAFSGNGVVPASKTFHPSIAGVDGSPHAIVYQYTTPSTGCSNTDTVKVTIKDANAFIDGFRSQNKYCNFDAPFIISGANNVAAVGSFSITGGVGIVDNHNNTATITPVTLGQGTFTVTYTYTNASVQLSVTRTFSVETLVDANIINLSESVYCSNVPNIKLTGTYNSGITKKGIFSGNGIVKTSDSLFYFKPSEATAGTSFVRYSYTTNYGCKTADSVQVTVATKPASLFEVSNKCWNNDITVYNNQSSPVGSITNSYWNFGDYQATEIDNNSTLTNPTHKYLSPGNKTVKLVSVTNMGCRDTVLNTFYLGSIPSLDFTWNTECFNYETPVNFTSSVSSIDAIGTYSWEISGSAINTVNYVTPNCMHSFGSAGDFRVKLLIKTIANCENSIQKQIRLKPTFSLKDGSYSNDFENGKDFWFENENTSNKWMFGLPSGTTIKSTYSGVNSFYTSLGGPSNQQLIVSSPCFNFTQTGKPFIEMWINSNNPKDTEGAVLQYQLENTTNWHTLGSLASGINWYNSNSIASSPGNQSFGWSGATNGWIPTRHSLDELIGNNNVRFQVVYATNASVTGRDGFAFDNVFIGQRNKTIMLEHFANNSSTESNLSNSKVSELLGQAPSDIVSLQYHTSFPGVDSLNSNNKSDPSARVLYYGVENIPTGYLNGGAEAKYVYDFSSTTPNISDINFLAMRDAEYKLNITVENVNSVISGSVKIEALKNISQRQTMVYIAIAEDIAIQSGANQIMYFNVLKKFLPTAAGTPLNIALAQDQSVTFPFSWASSKIYNFDRLWVIAFIQDELTREIYQVASSNPQYYTAILPFQSKTSNDFIDMKVYPNPASDLLFVSFDKELAAESVVQLIDNYGRMVKNTKVFAHISALEMSISDLPEGIYFVRLIQKGAYSRAAKVLVMH